MRFMLREILKQKLLKTHMRPNAITMSASIRTLPSGMLMIQNRFCDMANRRRNEAQACEFRDNVLPQQMARNNPERGVSLRVPGHR